MFQLIQRGMAARWRWALSASAAAHLLAVCLLLRPPAPVFVWPQAVVAGAGGTSVTALYLPYDRGVHSDPATEARVSLNLAASKAKSKAPRQRRSSKAPLKADQDRAGDVLQTARAGSPYGSLADGPADGREIRPALPVAFVNPQVSRSELPPGVQGDVVVEVTIDARGNIVEKRILQRLGYGIDEKVLAALEGWRFTPATQDGVPISSQHDIHFHFPN